MSINCLQSFFYGLVSGLTELLPISSYAHQTLLRQLFGMNQPDPVLDLVVHIAFLISLLYATNNLFGLSRRDRYHPSGRTGSGRHSKSMMNMRLVKNASIPMLIGMLILFYINIGNMSLLLIPLFLIINGLVLFIPGRIMLGNKDVQGMTTFDSFLIGVFGAFGVLPGVSRMAATTTLALSRGADRQSALNWSLLLTVPAVGLLICRDFLSIFSVAASIPFWSNFLSYLTAIVGAFCGGYLGVKTMRTLAVNIGFTGFAFYSWGFALLSFLIYLTVV